MKNGLTVHLLTTVFMAMIAPTALAIENPPPQEPSTEAAQPRPDESPSDPGSKPLQPVAGSRGQLLYENQCQGCHTSVVHVREDHRARTLAELQGWVMHWSNELKLSWKADEIGDVVDYLNRRYYKFEAPTD
jgi:hypothetical protein